MSDTTKDTLESIERLLIHDAVGPRVALRAAYALGRLDGQLEMAKVGERRTNTLLDKAAA